MLEKIPGKARPKSALGSFIRKFDPNVPGYVFWLVMLALISFQLGVVGVR